MLLARPTTHLVLLSVALIVALSLALPDDSFGSSASYSNGTLRLTAPDNQRNALTITKDGNYFKVVESGKSGLPRPCGGRYPPCSNMLLKVHPGEGCKRVTDMRVRCLLVTPPKLVLAEPGDLDDQVWNETDTNSLMFGGLGNDDMDGGSGDDWLFGEEGNDWLDPGNGGTDSIFGGKQGGADDGPDDTVSYWHSINPSSGVTVTLDGKRNDGRAGENDLVAGDIESVHGSPGSDFLIGNAGNNRIGDSYCSFLPEPRDCNDDFNNDVMDGGGGADTIDGWDGVDTVVYWTRTAPVNVSLDDKANDGQAGEGDNIGEDIENIVGGSAADTLVGNNQANVLTGLGGADTFRGLGGPDRIEATDGRADASIDCGKGRDTLIGDSADRLGALFCEL